MRATRRAAVPGIVAIVALGALLAACGDDGGGGAHDGVATGPVPEAMCGVGLRPAAASYERGTGVFRWVACTEDAKARRTIAAATDDVVTVAFEASGRERLLLDLDARTGAVRGTRTEARRYEPIRGCGADPGIAGVVVDGVCISGGQDDPLVATDASTRATLWTAPDAHPVYDDIWAVGDGAVYLIDNRQAALVGYELRTGRERWRRSMVPYRSGWPWIVENGVVYCIWNNLTLVSTRDGHTIWRTDYPDAAYPRLTDVAPTAAAVVVAFSDVASGGD